MTRDEPAPVVGFIFGPRFWKSDAPEMAALLADIADDLGLTFGQMLDLARRCLGTGKIETLEDLRGAGRLMRELSLAAGLKWGDG